MKETVVLNGNEYRVAANWNAIRDYCQRKGVTDLRKIGSVLCFGLDGVLTMAHCCIKEGERLEGRELGISEMELGEMFSPGMMTKFIEIYARQTTVSLPVRENAKKK